MSASKPLPTILPLGALIQNFPVGPKNHNIVLNFDTADQYVSHNSPYFGETIGRVCNRISNATIKDLNGQDYPLAANDGPNCLHGGLSGWGKKTWTDAGPVRRRDADGIERDARLYTLHSPHADEGFPGAVDARVYYFAHRETRAGRDTTTLEVEYEARLVGDAAPATVLALTNHSYFNLTAGPDVRGTRCVLPAGSLHLPVDETQIPTGAIVPFPGLPERAGEEFVCTRDAPRVDHCLVMPEDAAAPAQVPLDTRGRALREQVRFAADDTGVTLVVSSTEPAFQFYTGDGTSVPAVGGVPARGARSGVAVEPSRFVNAVNGRGEGGEAWRGQVLLGKGEVWGARTRYVAWADEA